MFTVLLWCIAIGVNALYAAAGATAAKRYDVHANLARGVGMGVLMSATGVELFALFIHRSAGSTATLMITFGAVAAAAAYDAASGYVFDAITIPCLSALAVLAAAMHSFSPLLGAAAAGGCLALLYVLTRGRGLGIGDVKLACCIGAGAGVMGGLEALGLAFVLGGVYAAYLLLSKRGHRGDELRFAPYMAAGLAIVTLHGALR